MTDGLTENAMEISSRIGRCCLIAQKDNSSWNNSIKMEILPREIGDSEVGIWPSLRAGFSGWIPRPPMLPVAGWMRSAEIPKHQNYYISIWRSLYGISLLLNNNYKLIPHFMTIRILNYFNFYQGCEIFCKIHAIIRRHVNLWIYFFIIIILIYSKSNRGSVYYLTTIKNWSLTLCPPEYCIYPSLDIL